MISSLAPLRPGDFCPYNRWSDNNEWYNHLGIGSPLSMTDQTTGQQYYHLSKSSTRYACCKLAVVTPIIHLIAGIKNAVFLTYRVVTLAPFREIKAKKTLQVRLNDWMLGTKQTHPLVSLIRDIVKIAFTIPIIVGLELSALYGIVSPHDGRKLYTNLERLLYDSRHLSHDFKIKNPKWTNVVMQAIAALGFSYVTYKAQYYSTYLHEYGHYLAFNTFFDQPKPPTIVMNEDGSGYCQGSFTSPKIFSSHISNGLVCAAGPIVDQLNVIGSIALALLLKRKSTVIASLFALHAFVTSRATFLYALRPTPIWESRSDYERMADNFGIPKTVFTAITGISVLASYTQMVVWSISGSHLIHGSDPSVL